MRTLLGALLLVVCVVRSASADSPAAPPKKVGPEPIAWRQNVFSIPFRVNRAQDAPDAPVEMQLFVSVDQGLKWHLASRSKPVDGQFSFRAPEDAEYWFSLRSVDRQGQLHPAVPHEPELKVVVDTLPPRLELRPTPGPAGDLEIEWLADDSFLIPSTLRIEYQTAPDQPWQQLAIGPPEPNAPPTRRAGRSTWMPAQQSGKVILRAEVADRAGNRTVTLAPVDLARLAAGVAETSGPEPDNNPMREASLAETAPFQEPEGEDLSGTVQPWPADRVARKPLQYQTGDGRRPATKTENTATPPGKAPVQIEPQLVQGNEFQLGYNARTKGEAKVAKVEIWGTADGGQTWQLYAVDPDQQSPATVQVRHPGVYGFSVVVQDSTGAGDTPPRPGQTPNTWLRVVFPSNPTQAR